VPPADLAATDNDLPSANCPLPTADCLSDETAARADELFHMAHGYPRNNPPKHIPNRRREEDFRSSSVFGDPRKIYG
jgi:hypothetical protein